MTFFQQLRSCCCLSGSASHPRHTTLAGQKATSKGKSLLWRYPFFSKWWGESRRSYANQAPAVESISKYAAYPSSLPPPPLEILNDRQEYEFALLQRRHLPIPRDTDTPLQTLYRLYEAVVLDWHIGLRNEIEYFWRKPQWPVHEIPDPTDSSDPARYAILSCIPALLVDAFNRNIELGLPRDAPAIMTDDEIDEVRLRPKVYESVPQWTKRVPALAETLRLPHFQSPTNMDSTSLEVIQDANDERISPVFKEKNILIWHPHNYFI